MHAISSQPVRIPVNSPGVDYPAINHMAVNGNLYGSSQKEIIYSHDELSGIKIPKLLINSENDGCADDTRETYNIFSEPKEIQFYSGDAHGTELFVQNRELLVKWLNNFIVSVFHFQ